MPSLWDMMKENGMKIGVHIHKWKMARYWKDRRLHGLERKGGNR